jgi:hypothetical protein
MTRNAALQLIGEIRPNATQFKFTTRSTPALTKKNRTTKEPTTFTVEIRSEFIASVGVNYEDEVNDKLAAEGKPRDFVAQKPFGKHYVDNSNWLMEADGTPDKFYIALSRFSNYKTQYFIDGVLATPEQIADLKENYLPKRNGAAPIVEWKTYSLDNIVDIQKI